MSEAFVGGPGAEMRGSCSVVRQGRREAALVEGEEGAEESTQT